MGQEVSLSTAGRVSAIIQAGGFRHPADRQPRERPPDAVANRALVLAAPAQSQEEDGRLRPGQAFTPFLVQLAAMRARVPQFRHRCRAEPAAAAACYASGGRAPLAGSRFNRSI